jgi:GT2 family glycosyltransferase
MTNDNEFCEKGLYFKHSWVYTQPKNRYYFIATCTNCKATLKLGELPIGETLSKPSKKIEIESFETTVASIIIPSFKRPNLLKWGLFSLSQQKTKYPFEVIVLNDGIEDETEAICNSYKDKLNIRYIFTGQRNEKEEHWRIPGYAINIGAKLAVGDVIILMCPEIYIIDNCLQDMIEIMIRNKKSIAITSGFHEKHNLYAKELDSTGKLTLQPSNMTPLDTELPFFMAIDREDFISIGGYDEDFIGYCWDDNDIVSRLKLNKGIITKINAKVVHLNHPKLDYNKNNIMELWKYNKKLYDERKNIIVRNKNKVWGIGNGQLEQPVWHLKEIPKIAHFYWGHPYLPYLNYLSVYTFHKYNPDWEIRLYYAKSPYLKQTWKDSNQKFTFTGKNYYKELRTLPIKFIEFDMESIEVSNDIAEVFKSEYLKNYLLSKEGGLWSDMDILYFKPMHCIDVNIEYNKSITNIVSIDTRFSKKWVHSIGFLLSSPNNEYHKYFFEEGKKHFDPNSYQSLGALLFNEVCPYMDSISIKFPKCKAVSMNYDTVYAYGYINRNIFKLFSQGDMRYYTKNSIGCHWYGGWKEAIRYINEVNETNYKNFPNVLCKTIRLALND